MRPRTIILILAGVLFINVLTVLGVWIWSKSKQPHPSPLVVQADEVVPEVETPAGEILRTETSPAPVVNVTFAAPDIGAAWAEFESPRSDEVVPRRFRVTGRCGNVPPGSRLMLVVDSGRGVFSPKFPVITVEGETWSGVGNEFGAPSGGMFSLCVFAVSEEAVEKITEWHEQGKATGKWPPFRGQVPGGVSLARIKLRVADK